MQNLIELDRDNAIIAYPYTFNHLQAENPHTNFGSNKDVLHWFPHTAAALELGYRLEPVLQSPVPEYDARTQYLISGLPQERDGQWYTTWIVGTYDAEQQEHYNQEQRRNNRQIAIQLLAETDWAAIPSVGDPAQSSPFLANQRAFIEYRSQVRRIAIHTPIVVEHWPIKPESLWEG